MVEKKAPIGCVGSKNLFVLDYHDSQTTVYMRDPRLGGDFLSELEGTDIQNIRNTVSLTITNTVTGSASDPTYPFNFTVTSSLPMAPGSGYTLKDNGLTATFALTDSRSVTLNVMKGTDITVFEESAGYTMTFPDGVQKTTAQGEPIKDTFTYAVASVAEGEIVLHAYNNKEGAPDTGVTLDSLPYWLMLSLAAGAAVLALKRRRPEW